MSLEVMKQALEALGAYMEATDSEQDEKAHNLMATVFFKLKEAIEQAEEKNCKNCVIDKPCIAKGKDMQICGAFVSKHAKELKQIALEKKAENARELGLDYEPVQVKNPSEGGDCDSPSWCNQYGKCHRKVVGAPMLANCMEEAEKREWVSLTVDEIWEICKKHDPLQITAYARAIEKALKEKNT